MIFCFLALPLFTCILLFFISGTLRKAIAITSCILQLLLSLTSIWQCKNGHILVSMMGGWSAPFGIALVIDLFSAIFLFATLLVFLSAILYGMYESNPSRQNFLHLPLLFFLLTGTNLTLITGDFFNLFVAFEIMLTSSYALFSLEAGQGKVKAIYPYVAINLAGSMLFLWAAAMIYGLTGNLNMAALSQFLDKEPTSPLVIAISFILLCVTGLKAGIFPLYFWLPDSYPTLPYSLAGLFGGVLSKIGIYVLMRLFITVLPHNVPFLYEGMIFLGTVTMIFGVLGAISKTSIKGILSYHIVSQVGYIVWSIGMFTPIALSAALLFTIHNMWVKASLFFYGGITGQFYGTDWLKKMGGAWNILPLVGTIFLLQALSLAGLPPLSGFWGKYLMIREGIHTYHLFPVFIAFITSWLTLFSMMKIWNAVFWQVPRHPYEQLDNLKTNQLLISGLGLVIGSLMLGFGMEYSYSIAENAISILSNKKHYIEYVYR